MTNTNTESRIQIISGEGVGPGHVEAYTGCGSDRALRSRLTRERCGGDRWARATIYQHEGRLGPVGWDFETGESVNWIEQ